MGAIAFSVGVVLALLVLSFVLRTKPWFPVWRRRPGWSGLVLPWLSLIPAGLAVLLIVVRSPGAGSPISWVISTLFFVAIALAFLGYKLDE